jgi:WD40 repeat protein
MRTRVGGFEQYGVLNVSVDGSQVLAATHNSGKGRLVHLDLGAEQSRVLTEFSGPVPQIAFAGDGSAAVIASANHWIRVWDLRSGECKHQIMTITGGVTAVAISDDARWILTGGRDHTVRLWDMEAGRCMRTFREHTMYPHAVWLAPDGRFGRSAGQDNTIRSWTWRLPIGYQAPLQLSVPRKAAEISRLGDEVRELVSYADQAIAAASYRTALTLLTRTRAIAGHERDPRVLRAWRDLGQYLPRTGLKAAWTVRQLFWEISPLVYHVSMSADARVAAVVHDHRAALWDLESGTLMRELPLQPANTVGLSADGQRVMAAFSGHIKVWSVHSGDELCSLYPGETGGSESISVTADCSKALFRTHDNTLALWDLDAARCLLTLSGHTHQICTTWIDAAGHIGASAAIDSIRLWILRAASVYVKFHSINLNIRLDRSVLTQVESSSLQRRTVGPAF